MLLGHVFERFAVKTPFAVMARSLLERTLTPDALDSLFEEKAQSQYTRELTFSSVVDLMGQVVTSSFGSVRAAYLNKSFDIPVSLTSLYNKLQGVEPAVSAALVGHSAGQLLPLIQEVGGALPEPVAGYRMFVLDGNNIAATVFGQLAAAMLIDHFGWLGVDRSPINAWKVGGVILLFLGALLLQKR